MSAYPVPSPPPGQEDPRFAFGLIVDVVEVLKRHGYPEPESGSDWVDLQQALFVLLHCERKRP